MSEPRATRIVLSRHPHVTTELWMGGAHALGGEPVAPADVHNAWVIDCAGDMPEDYRSAAAWWLFCVFADFEEVPKVYPRIETVAHSLGRCLVGAGEGRDGWEHPHAPPARLYVLCNQGLNRSGLVLGRILRALGLEGDEALAALAGHRPGAVNNLTFARLVRE